MGWVIEVGSVVMALTEALEAGVVYAEVVETASEALTEEDTPLELATLDGALTPLEE